MQEHPTTLVSLREYLEMRLCAIEKATELARGAMERRLEGLNELRGAMSDQSGRMATRQELEDKLTAVDKDLRTLREFQAELRGKASQQSVIVAYVIAAINLALSLVSFMANWGK